MNTALLVNQPELQPLIANPGKGKLAQLHTARLSRRGNLAPVNTLGRLCCPCDTVLGTEWAMNKAHPLVAEYFARLDHEDTKTWPSARAWIVMYETGEQVLELRIVNEDEFRLRQLHAIATVMPWRRESVYPYPLASVVYAG